MPAANPIDWTAVDWRRPTAEIARETGRATNTVSKMRAPDKAPHGNTGNRNAAKPESDRLTAGPAITIRGVRERGLYAKSASKRGMKLAEWCREALAEKLAREQGL